MALAPERTTPIAPAPVPRTPRTIRDETVVTLCACAAKCVAKADKEDLALYLAVGAAIYKSRIDCRVELHRLEHILTGNNQRQLRIEFMTIGNRGNSIARTRPLRGNHRALEISRNLIAIGGIWTKIKAGLPIIGDIRPLDKTAQSGGLKLCVENI